MALSGSLAEFDLSNIFLLIEQDAKTGMLIVKSEDDREVVVFKNGQVVHVYNERENIKEFVFRYLHKVKGYSAMEIRELNSLYHRNLHLLAEELITKGYMTSQELTALVQTAIIDITCEVFDTHDGDYIFEQLPNVESHQFLKIALPANFIMLEAARRSDEWVNIGTVITDETIFTSHLRITPSQVRQPIGNFALYSISFVDGIRTVEEICAEVFFAKFHVYKAIDEALRTGKIALFNTPEPLPSFRWQKYSRSSRYGFDILLSSSITLLIAVVIVIVGKFFLHDVVWHRIIRESNFERVLLKKEQAEMSVESAELLYRGKYGTASQSFQDLIECHYTTVDEIEYYLQE